MHDRLRERTERYNFIQSTIEQFQGPVLDITVNVDIFEVKTFCESKIWKGQILLDYYRST